MANSAATMINILIIFILFFRIVVWATADADDWSVDDFVWLMTK